MQAVSGSKQRFQTSKCVRMEIAEIALWGRALDTL